MVLESQKMSLSINPVWTMAQANPIKYDMTISREQVLGDMMTVYCRG
jgi:hypothetical protein